MKVSNLFFPALLALAFLTSAANAHPFWFWQPERPVVQLVRSLPIGDGDSVYFSASAPGRPIYNIYCENCCGFVGYPWEKPNYEAGHQYSVQSVDHFRDGGPPEPYTYTIVWRFKGGRLQCTTDHRPDAAFANRVMRGYIRVSQ